MTSRFFTGSRFSPPVMIQRVRLRFSRSGPAAFTTHLKQIDVLRRALAATTWPLAKSQGARPKIKVSFGPAISVGYESEAEYCDAELLSRLDPAKAPEIAPHLPEGYKLMQMKSVPRFFPSLEETLNAGLYEVRSPLLQGTSEKWERFETEAHVMVEKKKADRVVVIDARACVRSWKLEGDRLELTLRFGPGRTLKPERIIQAVCGLEDAQVEMGKPDGALQINRKQLFFEKQNGDLVEP